MFKKKYITDVISLAASCEFISEICVHTAGTVYFRESVYVVLQRLNCVVPRVRTVYYSTNNDRNLYRLIPIQRPELGFAT